jgi:hypothetical protein
MNYSDLIPTWVSKQRPGSYTSVMVTSAAPSPGRGFGTVAGLPLLWREAAPEWVL